MLGYILLVVGGLGVQAPPSLAWPGLEVAHMTYVGGVHSVREVASLALMPYVRLLSTPLSTWSPVTMAMIPS